MTILTRMHTFWRHSNCTVQFKLQVLQTFLFVKILFGLESAELTWSAQNHLDVFHLKCLRKIFKMKTTFIDREKRKFLKSPTENSSH